MTTRSILLASVAALTLLSACASTGATTESAAAAEAASLAAADNPFLADWSSRPFAAPPFDQIETSDFLPAFQAGIAAHAAEIEAIAASRAAPTFANTIEAMENSGALLRRVSGVFYNLTGTMATEDLRAVEREVGPLMTRHQSSISLNRPLFERIDALYAQRETLGLTADQQRVLSLTHADFLLSGAALDGAARERLAAIDEELTRLSTQFAQNSLQDTAAWTMTLSGEADLAGLPQAVRDAAAANAADLGREGEYVVTLQRSSVEPFLQYSTRRDLREQAFRAWAARGENGNAFDNRQIMSQMLALRTERARLLGFDSHAHYELDDRMAQTPERAIALMDEVWPRALARANEERADMQAMIDAEGGAYQLAAWDWRYYAEKVRLAKYELNDSELRNYLQLERLVDGMFSVANQLFGLTFEPRPDVAVYHPDVRAYEVRGADGQPMGLYFLDPFARPTKRSGAWMNSFRVQDGLAGERPIIVNVMNLSRAAPGQPVLMSWDDADTLFHEFGHALHGLMSDVPYRSIAGTSVQRDYVEFPSQVYESWLLTDAVLKQFAVHHETGEPMPDALIERLRAAGTFNQGFSTVEYLASAYIDMDLHLAGTVDDVAAAEAATLARIGMPAEIIARHRPAHFGHIFAGGYAAGYYGYLWAEVIGADAFQAFVETGDVFDAATARRFEEYVFSAGNRRDPTEAYVAFRGRMPSIDPLLAQRGMN